MLKNGANSSPSARHNQNIPIPHSDDKNGTFGYRVKKERKNQNISQERLAELAGITVDIVKRVEAGLGAKLEVAYDIAEALNVPLASLLPTQARTRDSIIRKCISLLEEIEQNNI